MTTSMKKPNYKAKDIELTYTIEHLSAQRHGF